MVTLLSSPRSPSAIFGTQASLAWKFIDETVVLTQATKASVTLIVSGSVAGTVTINGVVFTVDDSTPYTTTTFANGSSYTETVRNLADAVRANQSTANVFDITIATATSANGTLVLRAKDVGIAIKTTESTLSGASFSFVQGVAPDLRERTFYVYQGFAVDVYGNEIALTDTKMLPPGYNYNTGEQQPLFISLHESIQSHVELKFPSIFNPTSVGLDFNPIRLVYLRYGTITFDGCDILSQNIFVSPKVVALAQSADYSHKNGISLFVPSGGHQANTKLLSMGAEIGLPIHIQQYAWVSAYWNISTFVPNAKPAYRYAFYNSQNSMFSVSPVFTAAKPVLLTRQMQSGVLTVPVGAANIPHTIPANTAYIEVLVGHVLDGVFTRNYEAYKYRVLDTSCIEAEVYWKSPYGGWESLAFNKVTVSAVAKKTNSYFRDNETRVFAGKGLKDYKEWVDWLDDYGDSEIVTARKSLTLETKLLDFTTPSQKYFQAFINSPNKRLKIETGKDGQTHWVAATRVLTKTSDFTLQPESGLVRYVVELEVASNVE